MKVLALNPPSYTGEGIIREECCWGYDPAKGVTTPSLLLQVATVLRPHVDLVFKDAVADGDGFTALEALLTRERPDAVVTLLSWSFSPFEGQVVDLCNRLGIDCIAIPIPYGYAEQIARAYDVLFAVSGEPEGVVKAWATGTPVEELAGAVYRRDGEVIKNPDPAPSLEAVPPTAWDLIDLDRYDWVVSVLERNCPYSCEFCVWARDGSKSFQIKPVDVVLDDLAALEARGVRHVTFMAAQISTKKGWLREFCEKKVARGIDVLFEADIRANEVNEALLTTLRDAGCVAVYMGIETTSHALAKDLNMGPKYAEHFREAIAVAKKVGLHITVPFLFNIGETDADVDEYIKFVQETQPTRVLDGFVEILDGTPLHRRTEGQPKDYLHEDTLVPIPTFAGLEAARARRERFARAIAQDQIRWKLAWYATNPHARAGLGKRKMAELRDAVGRKLRGPMRRLLQS